MNTEHLELVDGPDKPALQWALAYPNSESVRFSTSDDSIDAEIRRIDELADGLSFEIYGVIRSGANKDRTFKATYSVEGRSGTLKIDANGQSELRNQRNKDEFRL
ncbi:MAG: hypothetical protein AB7E81_01710 [Hyphomicrobiaceae bacterium]